MPLTAEVVHDQLRLAARRLRWSHFARHLLAGLAASLSLLLIILSCDLWLQFGHVARWTGLALFLLPTFTGLLLACHEARINISEASMALRLERAIPGARNELINAVMLDRELAPGSRLRTALFSEMSDPFPQVNWSSVLDLPRLKRVALALGFTAAALLLWALAKPRHFNNSLVRILLPSSQTAALPRTRIGRITPGHTQITHDHELSVSAVLGGDVPDTVWLYFSEAGGGWQREPMDREVGTATFTHHWKALRQPIEYYIVAGDNNSATYRVDVHPKTAVAVRTIEIEPPAYTHLAKTVAEDAAVLPHVLPGSRVTVTLKFNNPVQDLQVTNETGARIISCRLDDQRYQFAGLVMSNGAFNTRFCDTDLVCDTDTMQYVIESDEPPRITIISPAAGSEIQAAPDDTAVIRFNAADNFGLASLALYRSASGNPTAELIREWNDAAGQRTFAGEAEIPLSTYAKQDRVTFRLMATDVNDVTATPGTTISRPFTVVLRSADKIAGQVQEARRAVQKTFQDAIHLQKDNLSATLAKMQSVMDPNRNVSILVDCQAQIADLGRTLAGGGEQIPYEIRRALRGLSENEMPAAVATLRTAASSLAISQTETLLRAVQSESLILARLKSIAAAATGENGKADVRDAIAGLEDLDKRQRDILAATKAADAQGAKELSEKQNGLGTRAAQARKLLERTSQDPAAGDADFRQLASSVAGQFGQLRVSEDMLAAAERLQSADMAGATAAEEGVAAKISKLSAIFSEWQCAAAADEADRLREAAKNIAARLERLKIIQQQILTKASEVRRDKAPEPEDATTTEQIHDLKNLMAAAVEKMLADAEGFPDVPIANEMRSTLSEAFKSIQPTDLDDVRIDNQTDREIAVKKEDKLLKSFILVQKTAGKLEQWLPNVTDGKRWQFEMPGKLWLPNVLKTRPADTYTELVVSLLGEQKGIQEQIVDSPPDPFPPHPPAGREVRAAAARQASLADKTARIYAQATMLYLQTDGLPEVTRAMELSSDALKAGRIQDFKNISRKIIDQLTDAKNKVNLRKSIVSLKPASATRAADEQLIDSNGGEAPTRYRDAVGDYYRSLLNAK